MRAIVYSTTGPPGVLRLVERPVPECGPGEVRVRVAASGVNPTDWKARYAGGTGNPPPFAEVVPNQDGSGIVDAVGDGVPSDRVGERVWVWEACWQRANGTAQEYVVLPAEQAVPLPDGASFELGASLGIPELTAHRCLTVSLSNPPRLSGGSLDGRTILVGGGAGAVGHAAIELARWAGARVVATVSDEAKASLARAAGADHVVDYRSDRAAEAILDFARGGISTVVEVAPSANLILDLAVLAPQGTVAVYANGPYASLELPLRELMTKNVAYQSSSCTRSRMRSSAIAWRM
jgi:NADPH2:quinone reductase